LIVRTLQAQARKEAAPVLSRGTEVEPAEAGWRSRASAPLEAAERVGETAAKLAGRVRAGPPLRAD